jgi:predicted RNase H-like HicB family nuclease
MQARFTAVFRKEGDWWAAYVEELPGANTQGRTIDEARENLRDAVSSLIEVNREIARERTGQAEVLREELLVDAT